MPEPENKSKMISLRLRPCEVEALNQQAAAVNLSRSNYIMRKLQGLPVLPTRVPAVNWQLYEQLGAIASQFPTLGNNINQIAHILNTAKQQGQPIPENLPEPETLQQAIALIKLKS
jgi:hypothetical protein